MYMVSVSSSNIASIGYENGILHIAFHSGGLYEYTNVPVEVYRGLMAAGSHGQYFQRNIKGVYPYRKIG